MLDEEENIIKVAVKIINKNLKKALLLWLIYFDILLIISTITIIGVYLGIVIEENPAVKWIFNRNPLEAIILSSIINGFYATLYIIAWLISLALSVMCFKSTFNREFKTMKKLAVYIQYSHSHCFY